MFSVLLEQAKTIESSAMGLFKRLQAVDRRFAISFLLAVFGTVLAIYTAFYQRKAPNIRYEVVSSASVFDIKEDVNELDIIFKGVSLRQTNQTLTLITFNVANTGSESVTKASYDDKAPMGYEVLKGQIIKSELQRTSNDYLAKNLSIFGTDGKTATFSPVILDPNDSFSVKLLILHSVTTKPSIQPTGKIAGIREIELVLPRTEPNTPTFWSQALGGNVWVQLTRVIAYVGGLIILIVTTFILVATISAPSIDTREDREKHVGKFIAVSSVALSPNHKVLFDLYIEHGFGVLDMIGAILLDPKGKRWKTNRNGPDVFSRDEIFGKPFLRLKEAGLLSEENGKLEVDEEFQNIYREFKRFVSEDKKTTVVRTKVRNFPEGCM